MDTPLTDEGLWEKIRAVDGWLTRHAWAGFDPYDVLGHPYWLWVQRLPSTGLAGLYRRGHLALLQRLPRAMRWLFRVQPTVNAKGVGLMAQAYIALGQATDEPSWRAQAEACLAWLRQHIAPGYHGAGWGYPFDWQAVELIPRGTPSSVVTATVGQAFWAHYLWTGDQMSRAMCESIGVFFLRDLHCRRIDDRRVCFSYTPLDEYYVHNANLWVAAYLLEAGAALDHPEWCAVSRHAVQWTLDGQEPSGAFPYWSALNRATVPLARWNTVDHIHTGYVIRCLQRVTAQLQWPEAEDALTRAAAFYHRELFTGSGLPKETPVRSEPVDIHACAEAILTGCALAAHEASWQARAEAVAAWTCRHLWHRNGHFVAAWRRGRCVPIVYSRWGQAWMLLALSQLIAHRQRSSYVRDYRCASIS